MIERKAITRANLRLAHLLSEKKVSNLVVTPNFDDFVSRGLTMFGVPHITCDHPHTVDRIDPEQGDLQIVHVRPASSMRARAKERTPRQRERNAREWKRKGAKAQRRLLRPGVLAQLGGDPVFARNRENWL